MNKFLFPVLLCAALCAGACSDDDDDNGGKNGDGPAGSVEMLYGTWGASHMWVEGMGQSYEMDVDASISTITFRADGTAIEYQEGELAADATWSYNPSSRMLHIDDSNFDIEYDWYVKELTDSRLIVDFTMAVEGVEMRTIVTYTRMGGASPALAAVRGRQPAQTAALGASLLKNVKLNTK